MHTLSHNVYSDTLKKHLTRIGVVAVGLTDSERLDLVFKTWLFLQEPQQVGGLHPLQLHLPVDVDFMVEAHVDEAGAVFTLLACVLT